MNRSQLRLNPLRVVPVSFALILNMVMGPLAPYISSALAPQHALGYVGNTTFELDGNINTNTAGNHDWDQVHAGTSGADNTQFITDAVNTTADDIFKAGGSKDDLSIQGGPWLWSAQKPQPKDDITHAFAAAYTINGHTIAYFGLDKYEVDGDNQVGFWFFKNQVAKTNIASNGGFKFSGEHAVGDILVLADYTNGGSVPNFKVYRWVGSGGSNGTLDLVASGGQCDNTNQFACGITNSSTFTSNAWPYQNRDVAAQTWPPGGLFEGGLDLTHFGLATGCFSSFLAETRSSQSVDSTLSDFALGSFSFCETPGLETNVSSDKIDLGQSVTDTANLSGNKGPVEGTIDFFVCGPTQVAQDCNSPDGDQVGSSVTIANNEATSDPFTPDATGFYCFRAEYNPAEGSKYLATSHTNSTTECFEVVQAVIHVTKTHDASSVSAGSPIGFTVTVSNSGNGDATGVTLNDPLPGGNAGTPVHWVIDGGDTASFAISGADGSQVLTLAGQPITLNAGASLTVHISAATTADNCAVYNNTANVASTNAGEDQASASTEVLCPNVSVTKVADADSVSAGSPIGFTVTISNSGPGNATGVTLNDALPGGNAGTPVHWVIAGGDTASFAISGADGNQELTLAGQPITLAAGASLTVHITAATTAANCATYDNEANVATTNDGSPSASDSTEVLCPELVATKTADKDPVSAGEQIGFTINVMNNGDGTATDVTLNDPLPAGADLDWSIADQPDGDPCSITGSVGAQTLVCSFGDLLAGTGVSVHVVSNTTADDCATYNNVATVTATNNPTLNPSDDVTVECPGLNIAKTAANPAIHGGDEASFTIVVWNAGPGAALNATLTDPLPAGESGTLDWSIDPAYAGPGTCDITGNPGNQTLTCSFGDLAAGSTKDNPAASITVVATTTPDDSCATLDNTAIASADNNPTVGASASIDLACPQLVIEKAADIDEIHFVFNANGSLKSVTPADRQVTWTLTYTLTDGPVTNAVICDPLPDFLTFVSASDGGALADGSGACDAGDIEWDLGTLSSSGTVSFVTTVDLDAPDGPIENVAVIFSDQTPEDEGHDSIRVTSEQVQAATPTPKPSVPNTAVVMGQNGQPIQIPIELLVVFFLGSLGTLALANVKAARRRR